MGFFKKLLSGFRKNNGNDESKSHLRKISSKTQSNAPLYCGRFHTLKIKKSSYLAQPNAKEVIYVESEYDIVTNEFIEANYDLICRTFRHNGYEFCYIPRIVAQLNNSNIIDYNAPYRDGHNVLDFSNNTLLNSLVQNDKPIGPSLMYYSDVFNDKDYNDAYTFRCIAFDITELSSDCFEALLAIVDDIDIAKKRNQPQPNIRYSLSLPSDDDYYCASDKSDDKKSVRLLPKLQRKLGSTFTAHDNGDWDTDDFCDTVNADFPDEETMQLIKEIETIVERLTQKGISEHIIQSIVAKPKIISRMIITRDNRIILSDYNNMEISMTPLVKAVYFLFLRHPQGINFKDLVDYRDELVSIYEGIKSERVNSKMYQSVCDITDPTKNSINEKVARIREAFVTRFDERLAQNYIVKGERGEAKCIPLNREFVEWQ